MNFEELLQYDLQLDCDPTDITCIINSNSIPLFLFPSTTTEEPKTTIIDTITTIAKKIATVTENALETTTSIANDTVSLSTTENFIHATINEVIPLESNTEKSATNNTNIVGIIQNISNSSLIERMQNNTSGIITNTIQSTEAIENATNSSVIEMIQNSTLLTTNSTKLPETQTVAITTASENLNTIVKSTTEKAVEVVTQSVKSVWNTIQQTHDNEDSKQYHVQSNLWLYILLGVIVAMLVLIGIVLILIYVRYRKHGILPIHNYYEISPMKESSSPLPTHIHSGPESECNCEMYAQYSNLAII